MSIQGAGRYSQEITATLRGVNSRLKGQTFIILKTISPERLFPLKAKFCIMPMRTLHKGCICNIYVGFYYFTFMVA